MNDKDYLRDNPLKDVHAWEDNRQLIPFQPTALAAKSLEDSPYFMDYKKLQEQKEYERKVRAGQIFPTYQGNDQFAVNNNPMADTEAFVESGPEWEQKVTGRIGWNEQSNKGVQAVLDFFDGKQTTYNWNPSDYGDPSNAWNKWSYLGEVGTGITKIFWTPEDRLRMQSLIEKMDKPDPNFDEATRLRLTDEFLKNNPDVAKYFGVSGIDLYDYTASAVSDVGLRFRIHQAVIDGLQNIKLGEFANTYSPLEQVGEALKNGIADPMLARDLAITTALTLGLGTIQVGAARLGMSLGQASVSGARAMAVARATQKALNLTSPFTGLAEGVAYAGIRAAVPTVGKSALATTLARTGAIATEASLQSVLAAYGDQRHEYEWRNLIFRGQDDAAFRPEWQQLALQAAIGAGMGTAMMGVMRFGIGAFGDIKHIRTGGWDAYKKNVAGSLDTWATTADGLTVWGDRLSQGRGVLFGDMVDNYMARSVDNRNLANIMVNGQRMFSRTVFNPTVAAKANFNMDEASKFADTYAETLGLPAEYVQSLPATSVERVLFDNLTDPEYLANAGLTYKEAADILTKFKDVQDKVTVFPEADPVMAKLLTEAKGNPKLAAKIKTDNRLLALADIFDIDYVNKQLQRAGVSFEKVNNEFKNISGGLDIDFGSKIHRDAYRELGRFAANGNKWAYSVQEKLKYLNPSRTTPLKVGEAEIDADTLRTALRSALDMDNRKSSVFLTDGFLDKDPTGIVEITPDGIVKVHRVTPQMGNGGKVIMRSDAFDHPDYTPENIVGIDGVNRTFETWKNKVTTELKKLEAEAKAKIDEEIEESVPAEVFAELGKAPTKQVLMRHFDLSGPEATVASMVMETLGLDIKKVVLKIIRARGKTLETMEAGKAVGAIEWRDIKSGVAALISTSKGADFGTLVHEMGHYNRMLFIGDSAEHVEFRHKLGITDDAWKKFTDWLGYDGPWENDVTKMTPEQRKAEEKFANAWAYYIRSIMFGDGKTNDSSLHRLFSAFGDHLGEMGKKMQTQDAMDKTMNFDVFAKAVYDKLFLRSEGRVTEFWESAVNGVFKNMPQADRERLGEAILGTELWNSHKAKIQKGRIEAEAKIAPLTPKVTRVSRSDIAKSLKGKMSGEGLSPSQKSIRAALKDGKSLEDIEKETRELWAKLQSEDQTVWEDNPALRPTSDMSIKGHVADFTDAQLLALPEGHRLKPINGVVRLVYNPDTKRMDVGFPVLIVTKDKINREIISRKARADALKRLRESRPKTTTETTTETKPTVLPDPNVIPERFDLGNGWTAVRAEKPSEEQLSKLAPDVVESVRTAISYKIVHVTDGNVGGNVVFGWDAVNNMYRPEPPTGINLSKQAQGKGLYGRFLQELSKYFDVASTGVDADTGTLPNAAKVWQKLKAKVEILKPNINFAYTAEELGKAYDNKAYTIRNQSRKISGVSKVETRTKTTIVDPVAAAKDITSDPIIKATTIDVPMREEPTNTVEGIPSTEQTIVHDVVDAVESANLGVREPDGTPVLEVTPDEAVEHTMQITQQETVQESLRDMNEVVPNPSTSEPEVVAQAVTVRDNARAELETLQQNLPVQIATTAVVVASARRATNTSVVELLRNILGNEPIPAEVIKTIEDYSTMDDRFLNILIKTEGTGGLTQQEVDAYMALPPDVIRKLEDAEVIEKILIADDIASMAVTLQQQTRVSMQQMNAYVVYKTKLQEARKTMTARKLQKQLDDNKVKYERYIKLQAIENKTPENLQEIESLQVAAGKYRSAAKQLGLIDAKKIVRQRVDEDFATFIYSKTAERKKTEMLVGRAKPNTIVTDEDFAVRLIANDEILVRLMKIANAADSNPEQMLSNIYRDGNFIDWFKRTMNVKDLTNEETFNLVLAWAKKEQDFPQLSKSLKTRAKTKAKENAAALKGTKKQVSSGVQTEEDVGIFEKTAGKELTDRSDQAADALISLFVNHLKSKQSKLKEGKGTLSLADYFMARRQLAEVPGNKAIATAKMIKEATGIEISENTVKNLNAKIEEETDTFFKDIVDDPEIGNFAKELIDERFGIKVRKTKEKPATTKARELLQSPLEEQIGNDLRKAMHKGEVKNAMQALEYIKSSVSQLSSIADFLSKSANQETLRRMPVLLLEQNVKYRSRKNLPVWMQVSFKNFVQQTGGQYMPTLHLVGINNDQRGLSVTSLVIHEIVHGLTSEYILTKLGIDQSKTGQDWLNDVKAAEATATGWVKKLLTAYLEAVDDGVSVDGIKFLNDSSDPAFNYWSGGAGYGLQNLDEFLSETLSSPSFMSWLLMTPDKTASYPEWTYQDLFNTMRQDPLWMGAVHLKADQNLLDVLTEVVKMGIADMSAVQRPDAAANWRLKKNFQALAVERHAKAAKRVNKNDPMLMQTQLKAIADLKASKGRLYQGLRQKAVYEMTLDEIFETPEFKDWFRDSKVIDTMGIYKPGSGKPMIMYHGSKYAGFTEFRNPDFSESRSDQLYGAGIYLTDDPGIASSYTAKESKAVMQLLSGEMFIIPKNAKPSRDWFENSTFGKIVKESVTDYADAQTVFSRVYRSMQQMGEDTERFWSDFEKAIKNLNKPRILSNLNTLWTAMNNTSMELGYPKYDKLWKRFESEMDYLDGNLIVLEDLGFKRLSNETGEGIYPVFASIQKPADVDNDLFSISDLVKRLETKLKKMEDGENPETIGEWEKLKSQLERASEVASLSSPYYDFQGYYSNAVYWRYPDKSAPSINKFLENPQEWWNSDLNPFKTKLRKANLNEKEINRIIEDTWESFLLIGDYSYKGIMSPDERLVEAIRNQDSYSIQELVDSLEESFIEVLLEFEDARVGYLSTSPSNRNFASTLYDGLGFIFSDTPTEDRITLFKLFPILRNGKVDHLMIQLLQTMGYDGLTHIGGKHMGDKDHRVFIAWKNTQVKSKFNKGGFGRTKSNLSLQSPPDVQPLIDAVDLREKVLFQEELNKVFPSNAVGVDSTGKPIKLFVGSNEFGIRKWDEDKIGMWFSSNPRIAKRFGNTISETYVKLTKDNTLVVDTQDYHDHAHIPTKFVPKEIYRQLMNEILIKVKRASPSRAEELKNSSDAQIYELFTEEIQDGNRISRWDVDTDTIAKAAKAAGYAGVWFKKVREGNDIGDQWVVFNKSSLIQTEGLWSLPQLQEIQPLIDAVDLRRRKLKELGLNEEMDAEELNMIGRILNGLEPVDVSDTTILERIGTTFTPSQIRKISSAFDGADYRSLSDNERRTFILESVIPKIRAAMGDRNSTNGFYSAFSSSDMGKRVNSLIGGAVDYGDTADSNSILVQFISKIFDPLMDMRDGEIMNKFEMPSVDRINAEKNNILMRIGLTRFTDKIAATVKEFKDRKMINDTAWLYLTRPEELPAGVAHRDLILEAINVINEFNRIRVDLLQSNKLLKENLDYTKYGTSHRANRYAEANQAAFVDAMNDVFVRRTRESNQLSIITASALGWVDLKRNTATDEILAIRVPKDSPLAKLMPEEKLLDKWVDWEGRIRKAFDDKTVLPKDIQDIHDRGLVSIDDYTQSWKDAYGSRVGKPYTALRQAAEVAKNRYLGIDYGDSKASSPRRQSIGEGRNYNEERIFSHDEIVRDKELSKFFRNDLFGLLNDDINTQIMDALMMRELTKFFGARMSMTDLMEILATTGEEIIGRKGLSQEDIESRTRGYERLRNSWNRAIGIIDSDKDSIDKYAKVVLRNSRIPLTLASSLRAAVTSLPELARALLTSNKNRPMLMQFLPNMVKLAKGATKNRRQARYQILSGTHWLRGLATDHILNRESMDPENPFGGTVFGENAGGMASNFINGWRLAGERNKYETNWLQRVANRLAPVSSAVGAPLTFVNDMSTLLHIWNAQENITTNLASFRKMAAMLEKDPTTDMAKFAAMAKKCGLTPTEALNLSTSGLLKTKYIDILAEAAKNQTLYSDGILDSSKLYAWAGDNPERLEAISMIGGYINSTVRLTNVEPTLLDIRVGQSLFGLVMRQYMQFFLSMGVQEIGRRRRNMATDYTKHLVGLLLMEVVAYGTTRALADPMDDDMGGIDEFEKNPLDYTVRTLSGLPLLGTYAWLSQVFRHTIMGASELMGGPGAEQEFRIPDLLGGPASSAPRRLGNIPDTAAAYYEALQELLED